MVAGFFHLCPLAKPFPFIKFTFLQQKCMKSTLFTALLFFSLLPGYAQSEEELIKGVIQSAYVDGIQNRGDVDDIRKGFHPDFKMLRFTDNAIKPLTIEEWISNIEKSKANNEPPPVRTTATFINVDVTGNAAVVKLELYKRDTKTFTDYLVLYKFAEGWRIVSKTFYRH